jgi:hypothetical protein
MPTKRYKPEQIVTLLRQIEVEIANGKTTPQACKEAQITVQTYYRWRKEFGGLKLDQAKRMKELERENAKLIHKRRNVKEHLPKNAQGDYDRRIRNAYAMTEYAAAKAELEKIFRQLERVNPNAAHSLEEGLEEALTVHRLGVGWLLRRTLASTNAIESCLSTVERVARNVKRWHGGDQALRWTATGLLEAERKFRKVKGFRDLATLQRKWNPSLPAQAGLTQQSQAA